MVCVLNVRRCLVYLKRINTRYLFKGVWKSIELPMQKDGVLMKK